MNFLMGVVAVTVDLFRASEEIVFAVLNSLTTRITSTD